MTVDDLKHPMTWFKASISFVFISLLLAGTVPLFYTMAQQQLTPTGYWFVYHAVEPVKASFKVGEPLRFGSDRTVHNDIDMLFSDTLYCDVYDGSGMVDYSTYVSERFAVKAATRGVGVWEYRHDIPQQPATCYLETSVIGKLKYADKPQRLKSTKFRIDQ